MFSSTYKVTNPLKADQLLRLVYFNIRGRGELIRYILHTAGVVFLDDRVEFDHWPAKKNDTPYGTLPYIEMDGHKYGESSCIARFLARKYNLMGKSEIDGLRCDAYVQLINDVKEALIPYNIDMTLTDEQKASLYDNLTTDLVPTLYGRLDGVLQESKSGYLVGNNVTIADLALVELGDQVEKDLPDVQTNFPKIQGHRQKITAIPELFQYLTKRPDTSS